MRIERNEKTYAELESRFRAPLGVLSIVLVVATIVRLVRGEGSSWYWWLVATILLTFFAEFVVLFAVAPNRAKHVRTHFFGALVVLTPFVGPIGLSRFLFAGLTVRGGKKAFQFTRNLTARRGLVGFVAGSSALIVILAWITLLFERNAPGATITSFGRALWWAIVSSTTVGYGDYAPITFGGRVVAVLLMMIGIAMVTGLTANVAAMLVDQGESGNEIAELKDEISELRKLIERSLPSQLDSTDGTD